MSTTCPISGVTTLTANDTVATALAADHARYYARGCTYRFEWYEGYAAVLCWNAKGELVWDAGTVVDPTDRIIDVIRCARSGYVDGLYR